MKRLHQNLVLAAILTIGSSVMSCKKPNEAVGGKLGAEKSIAAVNGTQSALLAVPPAYTMVWADEFNATGNFDPAKWEYAWKGTSAWNKFLTSSPTYASQSGGNLVLRADNAIIAGNNDLVHCGGVWTGSGQLHYKYGKLEVRAKINEGTGSFPAIWLVPAPAWGGVYGGWPNSGEIDIMEHVGTNNTISHAVWSKQNPQSVNFHASYNKNVYNTYGFEWTPTYLKFFVNGTATYTYTKQAADTWERWPFDQPFYVILNQSILGSTTVDVSALPFKMEVDYIRLYKKSILGSGDFESGSLSSWNVWNPPGTIADVVSTDAALGTKAVRLQGQATSIEQTITGLTPNTKYTFGGFGKVSATDQSVMFGVKNFGGAGPIDQVLNGNLSYKQATVNFTTGPSNTSATVYFYKPVNGAAYGDNFFLEKAQ